MTEGDTIDRFDEDRIVNDLRVSRAEVRAMKKMVENWMVENDDYRYPLGGDKYSDLDNLRTKLKIWLRDHQTIDDSKRGR